MKKKFYLIIIVIIISSIMPANYAQENKIPAQNYPAWDNWIQGDYLTTDWNNYRTKLEEKGISINAKYTAEVFTKARGGITNKFKGKYLGIIDTSITLDTEKLGLWKGGTLYASFQNTHGSGITTRYLGDIQIVSNIDPLENVTHLNEYYIIQSFFNDKLVFKGGKQDVNDSFAYLDNSEHFIGSSFTMPPNIPMPSYPLPGLGIATFLTPCKFLTLKYGLFDGNPGSSSLGIKSAFDGHDGVINLFEASINTKFKQLPGNIIAGGWLHTGEIEEITNRPFPREYSNNYGIYVGLDQMIYKENKDKEDLQGLYLMGQYSYTPEDHSEISHYYGGMLVYKGLFPHRNEDFSGIGVSIADISGRFDQIDGRTSETVLEVFHKLQLTPWLMLQPDLQFIFSPNGQEKNAIAIGIRSVINF